MELGGVVNGRVREFVPLPSPHLACSAHPAIPIWGAWTILIDRLLRWLYLFINVFSVYINPVDRTKVGCKRFLNISVKLVQSNLSFMTAKPFWLTMIRIIQISLAVENHDQSLLETKPYFCKRECLTSTAIY